MSNATEAPPLPSEIPGKLVKALAKFASTEEARPILNNFCFRAGEVCATNGHVLVAMPFEWQAEMQVNAKVLARAASVKDPVKLTVNGARIEGDATTDVPKVEWGDRSKYPDWHKVVPGRSGETPHYSVVLNAKYLKAVAEAVLAAGGERVRLDAFDADPARAVNFTAEQAEYPIHGLVMPMLML